MPLGVPVPNRGPDAISPTAHYTGAVWARHGLGHPAFVTPEGRVLFNALRPAMAASATLGGPTLEDMLLARHRVIDALLADAIGSGGVRQVIEIAAGLSPRGWRFVQEHPGLTYVEADLPAMAARKRRLVARAGLPAGADHRVVDLDALADDGPRSLPALVGTLDRSKGIAMITEGLLNYFGRAEVVGMWRRFAEALERFPTGRYFADLLLREDNDDLPTRGFSAALSAFVRGKVHFHFDDVEAARDALQAAGFGRAELWRGSEHPAAGDRTGPGARQTRIVDAAT